mgnify:CR=1 FL=1
MATVQPFGMKQPHIYGANALHWRQGTAVPTTESPPTWAPEMAPDPQYPSTPSDYTRDVSRWVGATKVSPERQGSLLALAIGGAGPTAADEIPDDILTRGAVADLGDGQESIQAPCSMRWHVSFRTTRRPYNA